MNKPFVSPAPPAPVDGVGCVLGTPLQLTTYERFRSHCLALSSHKGATSVDFTNTHIVTMRRHDPGFRALTDSVDYFVPDGMPLVWCLNFRGAKLGDRVYGPTFMREFIARSPAEATHYFLGGSVVCVERLKRACLELNPAARILGVRHGYFRPEEEPQILEEINRLAPEFIWVGLGTPRQQSWIHRHKGRIDRGVIFAVGFAFDVNAGTKRDAPVWMQRCGLTWLFRAVSEPRRLTVRYLRYNALFLFYLVWDGIRGRAFSPFAQ